MTVQIFLISFANFNINMHTQYTDINEVFNGGGQLNKQALAKNTF